MQKLPNASLTRLSEIRDGERPTSLVGLATVVQSGLAHCKLTPSGLFALRTGFVPSKSDLTLLKALERGIVWKSKGWRTDVTGHLRDAPHAVLSQFEQRDLAFLDRREGDILPYRATDSGRELVAEMFAHFGEDWAPDLAPAQ